MRKMSERVDQRVRSWHGHVVRMDEECLTKRVWKAEVSGLNLRGRSRSGWMEWRGYLVCEVSQWSKEERMQVIGMNGELLIVGKW